MSQILKTMFMCIIFAFSLKSTVDYIQDQRAMNQLKDALELATHDASLMLDVNAFSEGNIVFDKVLAEQKIKAAIEENLITTQQGNFYYPTTQNGDKSFFKEPIEILHVEYIDNSIYPSESFPCNYGISCGDAQYEIFETIKGPSVVLVAETYSPRGFSEKKKKITQAVVYEYGTLY